MIRPNASHNLRAAEILQKSFNLPVHRSSETLRAQSLSFSSTHRPFSRHAALSPRPIAPFSTTVRSAAGAHRQQKMRQQHKPSRNIEMKKQQDEMMRSGQFLEFLGVMQGTFIRPTRAPKLPSWGSAFRERLRLEYTSILIRVVNYVKSEFIAAWYTSPRPKLERREVPKIAEDLYMRMNRALASGNITPIESQLASGLATGLRTRIAQRPAKVALEWTLQKLVEKPRLVSYRFEMMPGEKGELNTERTGIFQAVVRIRSVQSLLRARKTRKQDREGKQMDVLTVVDKDGQDLPAEKLEAERRHNAKETTEYVVVQKYLRRGQLSNWQIWGTTEETSLAEVDAKAKLHQKQIMAQR